MSVLILTIFYDEGLYYYYLTLSSNTHNNNKQLQLRFSSVQNQGHEATRSECIWITQNVYDEFFFNDETKKLRYKMATHHENPIELKRCFRELEREDDGSAYDQAWA